MTQKPADQYIFPIIVAVLSVLNIIRNLQEFYVSSVLVSLVGILAVVLFLTNKNYSKPLFLFWILAQLITIVAVNFTILTNQFPQFSFDIKFSGSAYFFAINFVPLFYFIGFNSLNFTNIIGKRVLLKPIKDGSSLEETEGEIVEYIEFAGVQKWYKVEVNDAQTLYFRAKDEEDFKRKSPVVVEVKYFDAVTESLVFISWAKLKFN